MSGMQAGRPGFMEGVGVALVAAVTGTALHWSLAAMLPAGEAARVALSLLGLAYLLYLLARGRARVGRLTLLGAWAFATAGLVVFDPPIAVHLVVQLGTVWLARSLYFHGNVLGALADLGLLGLGVAVALWAAAETGSALAALWCFWLVQALFTTINIRTRRAQRSAQHGGAGSHDDFERAYATAEQACKRMAAR